MLSFKRDGSGTWAYGQKQNIVEDDSLWAINPLTYKRGYICFNDNNKVVGEHLVPISQPMPMVTELPDKGFDWQEQWAVDLKCISGTDAGDITLTCESGERNLVILDASDVPHKPSGRKQFWPISGLLVCCACTVCTIPTRHVGRRCQRH